MRPHRLRLRARRARLNNNKHHSDNRVLFPQAYPSLEQVSSTTGAVQTDQRTNTVHTAGLSRPRAFSVESSLDTSREPARLPASPSREWPGHSRHPGRSTSTEQASSSATAPMQTRPAKRGGEHVVFFNSQSRTGSAHSGTEHNSNTSGQPLVGGAPQHPDNPITSGQHEQRPKEGVGQDKGVLTNAPSASVQPAPDTKSIRAQSRTTVLFVHKTKTGRGKSPAGSPFGG